MRQLLADSQTQGDIGMDIVICVGVITLFSVILMTYSMLNYIRLRLRDYSLFVILGMRKRAMYAIMALEYVTGWFLSLLLGLVLGRGALWGILKIWRKVYSPGTGTVRIGSFAGENTCKVSFGIMAVVLFAVMVWSDNKDLSAMTAGSEVKEKNLRASTGLPWCLQGLHCWYLDTASIRKSESGRIFTRTWNG